jgi:hypothetical protein
MEYFRRSGPAAGGPLGDQAQLPVVRSEIRPSCRWSARRSGPAYTYKGKQCATIRTWEQTIPVQPSLSVQASVCESAQWPGGSGAAARGSAAAAAAAVDGPASSSTSGPGGSSSIDFDVTMCQSVETTNWQVDLLLESSLVLFAHRPREPAWRRFSTAFHWSDGFICSFLSVVLASPKAHCTDHKNPSLFGWGFFIGSRQSQLHKVTDPSHHLVHAALLP